MSDPPNRGAQWGDSVALIMAPSGVRLFLEPQLEGGRGPRWSHRWSHSGSSVTLSVEHQRQLVPELAPWHAHLSVRLYGGTVDDTLELDMSAGGATHSEALERVLRRWRHSILKAGLAESHEQLRTLAEGWPWGI